MATEITMRRPPRRAFLAGAATVPGAGRQAALLVLLARDTTTAGLVAVTAPPQCPPQIGDKKPLTTAAVAAIDNALSRVLLPIVTAVLNVR